MIRVLRRRWPNGRGISGRTRVEYAVAERENGHARQALSINTDRPSRPTWIGGPRWALTAGARSATSRHRWCMLGCREAGRSGAQRVQRGAPKATQCPSTGDRRLGAPPSRSRPSVIRRAPAPVDERGAEPPGPDGFAPASPVGTRAAVSSAEG